MNSRISWFIRVAALIPFLFVASCATNRTFDLPRPTNAMSIYFDLPRGARVCEMEQITSKRIRRHLPQCTIYSTTALDASANPAFVNQPFILSPSSNPMLLPDYSTSASFVSGLRLSIGSTSDAQECLLLLADIQNWQLCAKIPEEMRKRPDANDPNWTSKWVYHVQRTAAGWAINCVFLTDPQIRHYKSFLITITEQGTILIEKTESLGLAPGHSGYI